LGDGNRLVISVIKLPLPPFAVVLFSVFASGVPAAGPTPLPAELLAPALPDALKPERHPRLFVSRDDLATGRRNVRETAWGRAYLAKQKAAAARFVALDDDALRALVPKPHSLFVYGLGMNIDPVQQLRMTWAGWDDPFAMRAADGTRYPNAAWPDTGEGVVDPKTGERYYFVAQAYGRIMQVLEQTVLPALADVYALEGSEPHAHAAAVLLDAIAAVYPTNRRGPLDYPTAGGDLDRGGRLDRPYYQTARGLVNYGFVIDLVASSGQFEQRSAYGAFPLREHIARNLLWDGGTYCHDFAVHGYQLHNGHADYLRGAALVGVLLGIRELAEPMITGPLSLTTMLDVNVDRNGFYYETSPGYAAHNRELYIDMAETLLAMRRLGWRDVPDAYAHPNFKLYLTEPFNRQEVGGHLPTLGDAGPDRSVHDPMRRVPMGASVYSDAFIEAQLEAAWVQLVRGNETDRPRAAQLLADCYAPERAPQPTARRWTIYHVSPEATKRVAGASPDPKRLATDSVFYGAKGLALLRGGEGSQRYGAQLFFGPGHNHSQHESLTWTFFARGAEWSYAPGYFNKHYRASWISQSVSHLSLLVNGHSAPWENGTARLLAWHATRDTPWAMASHPNLYEEFGVTRFERLIAQVHNPATGEPAYWLDFGRIDGGEMRDDSFHTQMKALAASVPLPAADPARPALAGKRDLGAAVLASDYIAGLDEKQFYVYTPGEGYDFLGSPREVPLEKPLRVTLSDPLFATTLPAAKIVIDYVGAPGRRLIVADGGSPHGVPRVPYVVQRDTGNGRSVFAKIIRFADRPELDPLDRVERVPLEARGDSAACALLVTWRNGRRDLWIVGDDRNTAAVTAHADDLPEVSTDAQVAVISFDGRGAARAVRASGAHMLRVQGGPQLTSPGVVHGRVAAVGLDAATLRVHWDSADAAAAAARAPRGSALVTVPPFGASAAWDIDTIAGENVTLRDATLALAQTELRPVAGRSGAFAFASGVSRFYGGSSRLNTRYAIGKAVYAAGKFVGRVRSIEGGKALTVTLDGPGVGTLTSPATVRVLEVAEGDDVTLTLNLDWDAASP
jgi:hypothetical protein